MKPTSTAPPRHYVSTIYPIRFPQVERKYNEGGAASMKSFTRRKDPAMEAVEEQIRMLKNVVARLELELEDENEL